MVKSNMRRGHVCAFLLTQNTSYAMHASFDFRPLWIGYLKLSMIRDAAARKIYSRRPIDVIYGPLRCEEKILCHASCNLPVGKDKRSWFSTTSITFHRIDKSKSTHHTKSYSTTWKEKKNIFILYHTKAANKIYT